MISFIVHGIPRPQGSKRHVGNGIMIEQSKYVKDWRAAVAAAGAEAYRGDLLDGPVALKLDFIFPRPRSHYRTGKNADKLKDAAPLWHAKKPDASKLIRAVEDALTGVVWRDDSQVFDVHATKHYGEPARCVVTVQEVR